MSKALTRAHEAERIIRECDVQTAQTILEENAALRQEIERLTDRETQLEQEVVKFANRAFQAEQERDRLHQQVEEQRATITYLEGLRHE